MQARRGAALRSFLLVTLALGVAYVASGQGGWVPLPVADDPLVRMPGTQPGQASLEAPGRCLNCHDSYDPVTEPGSNWRGSMMAQASRDFLFWACLTVGAQDSIWAVGRPNGTDLCLRCHFPAGWVEGRSDPTNASAMTGADFDGVQCDFCHRAFDPFFEATRAGSREGSDWLNYWDETGASETPSAAAAETTYQEDVSEAARILLFNGNGFFAGTEPGSTEYTESASGQYFVAASPDKRASFADATARHRMLYSRFHKSKYFCGTCHDVSNPVLANLAFEGTPPGDGITVLPSESAAAHTYFHVERTFSEFLLSDYGRQGGAAGLGPFAPEVFDTSTGDNYISRCQDCHMPDVVGKGADKADSVLRPDGSVEHPTSGVPQHSFAGGNAFVNWVLASAVPGSPNYDPLNAQLLRQGPAVLTLDLTAGLGLDPVVLLAGADRARSMLANAAALHDLAYDPAGGEVALRVQNQTGHKLTSGFAEGHRMWLNIRIFANGKLIHEVNPYSHAAATLKGLPNSPNSPPLAENEAYADELVYEMHPSSTLTGEAETFHFVLADGRYKDNRVPPKGFRTAEMAARQAEPYWQGSPAPDYFTAEEYRGGYDRVRLATAPGGDRVEARLYYQTVSREYAEFLRDEIEGTADTLPEPTPFGLPEAYIVQTDPFFTALRAWGDTLWQLWEHNRDVPGAAPVLMTAAAVGVPDPSLQLAVTGECPGIVRVAISGATPARQVAITSSPNPGTFVIPSGACAGTVLDLAAPVLRGIPRADGSGRINFSFSAPFAVCGQYLQAVDLATCEVSNRATIP